MPKTQTTVTDIAHAYIARLTNDTDSPLSYYQAHRDGDCDFVDLEETLSSDLDTAGLIDAYLDAATIVFTWLRDTHHVQPPRWFLHEAGWDERCARCGDAHDPARPCIARDWRGR